MLKTALLKIVAPGSAEVNNGSTSVPGLIASGNPPSHSDGGALGDIAVGNTVAGRMEILAGGEVTVNRGYLGNNSGADELPW